MNSSDIKSLIERLSKATFKEEQLIIKSFLAISHKDDYDCFMVVCNKNVIAYK